MILRCKIKKKFHFNVLSAVKFYQIFFLYAGNPLSPYRTPPLRSQARARQ